jgi:hypothetical protein
MMIALRLFVGSVFEVFYEIGNFVVVASSGASSGDITTHGAHHLAESFHALGSHLIEDSGEKLLEALHLSVSTNNVGVGLKRGLYCKNKELIVLKNATNLIITFGISEVEDISVVLEEIYFLNSGNRRHTHFLEGGGQFLVIFIN